MTSSSQPLTPGIQPPPIQIPPASIPQSLAEAPWIAAVLDQIRDVNETNRMLVMANNKRAREEDSSSSSTKTKRNKITEPDPKDTSLWVRGQFDIQDNGSNVLGALKLRVALGGISAEPKSWYQGLDDIVKMPRRGSSLAMTHLLGARILHPQVRS